jgi:hypothetical protein
MIFNGKQKVDTIGKNRIKEVVLVLSGLLFLSMYSYSTDKIKLEFNSSLELDSIYIENLVSGNSTVLKTPFVLEIYLNQSKVGDKENLKNQCTLYPNPAQSRTHLNWYSHNDDKIDIGIFDAYGRNMANYKRQVKSGYNSFTIDLKKRGFYWIQVKDFQQSYSQRILNLDEGQNYSCSINNEVESTSYTGQSVFKSQTPNDSLSAQIGDLFKCIAYSNMKVSTLYSSIEKDSSYNIVFIDSLEGVYLDIGGKLFDSNDTIKCIPRRPGFEFGNTEGTIFALDSLILMPHTYAAKNKPVYSYNLENRYSSRVFYNYLKSGVLHPLTANKATTLFTVHDEANNYSKTYTLDISPSEFKETGLVLSEIQDLRKLNEISGIAASHQNVGFYWVHNDSGGESRVFLINSSGEIEATVYLDYRYFDNRDWEDITVGPGPEEGVPYIYVADIGDNNANHSNSYIYRFKEPKINTDSVAYVLNIDKDDIATINFKYADGPRDAEILMIDSQTKDLYVVSKRETNVQIYTLDYPQNVSETITVQRSDVTLPFRMTNGGDISPDGKEILIKNLEKVYYWRLMEGETIMEALSRKAYSLPYIQEPQGEAITWLLDGSGYITVSEMRNDVIPKIYFYKR